MTVTIVLETNKKAPCWESGHLDLIKAIRQVLASSF